MGSVRALCASLLCALLAVACSSANETADAADALPFDAVLIELFDTTDTEAYLVDTERAAAELVVDCMEDAGFEFELPPVAQTPESPAPGDLQAARRDGFGIIAGFRYQLSQYDLDAQFLQDPNQTYVRTLTAVEAERFFLTLDGPTPEPGQRPAGGCNAQGTETAYADWLRFFEALPNFTVLGEERDTHPDWLAARAEWRACMIDRGFDYAEPDAIRTDVISRMRETVNAAYPGGQVPVLEVDGQPAVDPQVDVLLDQLVQFETAAAVANVECTEPLAAEFDAVEQLVQQEFVDRNQVTIDELLAASK